MKVMPEVSSAVIPILMPGRSGFHPIFLGGYSGYSTNSSTDIFLSFQELVDNVDKEKHICLRPQYFGKLLTRPSAVLFGLPKWVKIRSKRWNIVCDFRTLFHNPSDWGLYDHLCRSHMPCKSMWLWFRTLAPPPLHPKFLWQIVE